MRGLQQGRHISGIRDRELVNVVHHAPTRGKNTLDLIIANLRLFCRDTTILLPVIKSECSLQRTLESDRTLQGPAEENDNPFAAHHRFRCPFIRAVDHNIQLEACPGGQHRTGQGRYLLQHPDGPVQQPFPVQTHQAHVVRQTLNGDENKNPDP